ncbi:MAG: T9SS type A sorting domain-containing protein [Flavobacteriales bacterium]
MKRIIYPLSMLCIGLNAVAQQAPVNSKVPEHVRKRMETISKMNYHTEIEFPSEIMQTINPTVSAGTNNEGLNEEVIGRTVYDLQTNNSIMHRIVNHGDGKISAIWTFGSNSPGFPERGMAYNHKTNGAWINNPNYATDINSISRVETERSGFGNLNVVNSGREVIISHQTTVTSTAATINTGAGNQSWNFNIMPSGDILWPKSRVGGPDGKSIHVIALTEPAGDNFNGSLFEGMNAALVYNRSTDEGATWDKVRMLIPGIDSSLYAGFSGDAYNIDVKGNVVAVIIGDLRHNVALFKSMDNGETWTKTIVLPFPFDAFTDGLTDVDGDGVADEIPCADGTLSVLIDNNNKCHVWYGNMRMTNSTPGQGTVSYFPGTSGIMYWNESFLPGQLPVLIADLMDDDGDDVVNVSVAPSGQPASYQMGLTSMPSSGIDADGNLYVAYMAAKDNLIINQRSYRHVYIIKSSDGGNTWTEPLDVTPFDDFTEYAYPSMARLVDNNIHIVYQRDDLPGIASAPNAAAHDFAVNDIVYQAIPKDLDLRVNHLTKAVHSLKSYPNPTTDLLNIAFNIKKPMNGCLLIMNTVGQIVFAQDNQRYVAGEQLIQINVNDLTAGIYFINLQMNDGSIFTSKFIKQ